MLDRAHFRAVTTKACHAIFIFPWLPHILRIFLFVVTLLQELRHEKVRHQLKVAIDILFIGLKVHWIDLDIVEINSSQDLRSIFCASRHSPATGVAPGLKSGNTAMMLGMKPGLVHVVKPIDTTRPQ